MTPANPSEARGLRSRSPAGRGWVWVVYGFLLILLLAYIISWIVRQRTQTWPLIDNWGTAGFEIVGSFVCILRATVVRRGRMVPLLLGLGLLAWSLGDLAVAVESAGGATPPVPSVADGFYLAFYPFSYAGVLLLMRTQVRRLSVASWLDGAIAGLGAGAVCAAFVVEGVLRSVGGGTAAVATDLAYPVGDLLLLVMVIGGTAVLPDRRSPRWLLLALGFGINAIGDTANLFQSGFGATHVGLALNALAWPSSILLVSTSVWLGPPRRGLRTHEPPPGFLLVGIAAFSSLAVLFVASVHHINVTALLLATAALALAGVRFGLSLMSLRKLTEARYAQAVTDSLTMLGNRRALFELLDAIGEFRAAEESTVPSVAFLFVDLNRFKEVNDTFGHAAGDELLRQLGTRLGGALRDDDLVVRLGGDEFGVALMGADADYGTTAARRISAILDAPFQLGTVRARISASIGIAAMPTDATDGHDLLHCADLAMYRAKLDGKSFAVYQEELDGEGHRMALVEDLRVAIGSGQLELHYQPQIELSTREVIAVEALVRWNHPRLGFIPPLEFLPLAEDAEMMDKLTALVLGDALTQCAAWRAEGNNVAVAVNISTTNLLDPDFPALVKRRLEQRKLLPEALIIEITETTAIADFDRCRRAIEKLRDLGLIVSVDDFGAGFTSLAYLSSLAVGELKLDRSFISGLAVASTERNLALVRSTIDLAHALGLRVVAEGVEDVASLEILAGLECDHAQGYLIGKPKPADQLTLSAPGPGAPRATVRRPSGPPALR